MQRLGPQVGETVPAFSLPDDAQPLNERVPVYQRLFRLTREVPLESSPQAAAAVGAPTSLTVSGRLEYQACDHKVCYNPTSVPLSWTFTVGALDRERVGGR